MNKYIALVPFITFFFLNCGEQNRIYRFNQPVLRSDINRLSKESAQTKTTLANIYVEHLSHQKWVHLMRYKTYRKKPKSPVFRAPGIIFYQIIIKNTQEKPLFIKDISIHYSGETIKSLRYTALKALLKSPTYSLINMKEMLSYRRLINPQYRIDRINYDSDTIGYTFDFIGPSDTIVTFAAFKWIPVQYKKFTVLITLNHGDQKKIIDFEIEKFEYRSNGNYFIEKNNDPSEENHEN